MAFIILLIFGLVVLPFFAMGVKRLWVVAAIFLIPVIVYAAYLWALPITEDEQASWRMIVLAIVVTAPAAFAGGMVAAYFARRRGINLEETFE